MIKTSINKLTGTRSATTNFIFGNNRGNPTQNIFKKTTFQLHGLHLTASKTANNLPSFAKLIAIHNEKKSAIQTPHTVYQC